MAKPLRPRRKRLGVIPVYFAVAECLVWVESRHPTVVEMTDIREAGASKLSGASLRGMPLFYFNLRNGSGFVRDEEGKELPGLDQARSVALTGARSLISAEATQGQIDLRGRIEVTDEQGRLIMTVHFEDAVQILHGELPTVSEGGKC